MSAVYTTSHAQREPDTHPCYPTSDLRSFSTRLSSGHRGQGIVLPPPARTRQDGPLEQSPSGQLDELAQGPDEVAVSSILGQTQLLLWRSVEAQGPDEVAVSPAILGQKQLRP